MKIVTALSASLLTTGVAHAADPGPIPGFRPPAVPLVVNDPYLSIWSRGDKLAEVATSHWTGAESALTSLIRIDGKSYRLMGKSPADLPALTQTSVTVLPLRTIYSFADAGVSVTLTFLTPMLPDDLDALSRPLTYLEYTATSTDGATHDTQIYLAATGQIVVNNDKMPVTAEVLSISGLSAARVGGVSQNPLATRGDQVRIDWGHVYVAAPKASSVSVGQGDALATAFGAAGKLPADGEKADAKPVNDGGASVAVSLDLGKVGPRAVSQVAMIAMNDGGQAINYFGTPIPAYWQRKGGKFDDMLQEAAKDYSDLIAKSAKFDTEVMADLIAVGGEKYATLAALAYRQSIGAGKLAADTNGKPLYFSKENSSNGCMATVDVMYPQMPIFLAFSPAIVKASLAPILEYCSTERWRWPFAPHDLGTFPQATGQVYGGGERTEENQMPVEETANMIIMLGALAKIEGNADFAGEYWPVVTKWAKYLEAKGFDPENQLCTDDFAGHLAHNTNLSIKAIEALGSYGLLCEMRKDTAGAKKYKALAKELAARWVKEADEGDHFKLAFDRENTWSQKYNMVWDKLLKIDAFPAAVVDKEIAYYLTRANQYGVPLDNRRTYAKTDWTLWTATMANTQADFHALVDPLYAFYNESTSRHPFSDWYYTNETRIEGFIARPVIGGVFIKLLSDEALWKKWSGRPEKMDNDWPAIPKPPKIAIVVPTAREAKTDWQYTFDAPEGNDWYAPDFKGGWKTGKAGFGTRGTPGAEIGTQWNGSDIWLRREFTLKAGDPIAKLQLLVHHDDEYQVYINGVLAHQGAGFTADYFPVTLSDDARATLKPGKNVIAIHCRQDSGGQYIDAGFVTVTPQK